MHILPTWINPWKRPSPDTVCIGARGPFGLFPLHVPLFAQRTHLYTVGKSGQGKSKLLLHLLVQLVQNGQGCGVIDPHSDLANDLLMQLASYPKKRPWLSLPKNQQCVIYLDPSRMDYIVPANVLKSSTMTPHQVAENVVDSFKRVYPETLSEAPRFAQIMRNTLVVLASRGLTLLELEPFLTDAGYRRDLLANFPDEQVTRFFSDQYNRWGREQSIFVSPVLNKVTALLFQPSVRASLTASENALDFRSIIDQGKVLICDLGGLTGETQQLYGSMMVANWEQSAMSRRTLPEEERAPYFLMIDEFPSFVSRDTKTLARILSEVRKFNCFLGLSHQTLSQTDERMQGALENCDCKLVFGTGRDTAAALAQQLYLPDPERIKHEVSDETAAERSHPLYEHIQTQSEMSLQELMRLKKRQVVVKLPSDDRLHTVRTANVPRTRITREQLEGYKRALLRQVGRTVDELARERTERAPKAASPALMTQAAAGESWQDAFYEEKGT